MDRDERVRGVGIFFYASMLEGSGVSLHWYTCECFRFSFFVHDSILGHDYAFVGKKIIALLSGGLRKAVSIFPARRV